MKNKLLFTLFFFAVLLFVVLIARNYSSYPVKILAAPSRPRVDNKSVFDPAGEFGNVSKVWDIDIGNKSSRLLLVDVYYFIGDPPEATCNDIPLTVLGVQISQAGAGFNKRVVYYLKNPPVGLCTITIVAGWGTVIFSGAALSLWNVDQANSFGTVNGYSPNVREATVSVEVADTGKSQLIIGFAGGLGGYPLIEGPGMTRLWGYSPWPDMTEDIEKGVSNYGAIMDGQAGSTTLTWETDPRDGFINNLSLIGIAVNVDSGSSPCQVTTSPVVLNLSAGDTANVTADVTSGLDGATITQMSFGSYNNVIAKVAPATDASPPYETTVTAAAGGNTAVWATAELSDGRECESGISDDTDVSVLGVPPPAPTYTISGNIFIDANKSKLKDFGENNHLAAPSIEVIDVSTNNPAGVISVWENGIYSVANLVEGTYRVSYISVPAGYSMVWPSPPNLQVTVGPACDVVDPTTGGSCTGFNVANLNFAITDLMPWIQTYGLDLRIDDGFTNLQPSNTTVDADCGGGSYASGGNSPGIIFSGDGSPDFGQGLPSGENWVVGGMSYPEVFHSATPLKTSTQSLLAAAEKAGIAVVPLETINQCDDPSNGCNLSSMNTSGFYHTSSDVKIDKNKTFNNGNYVIVSDGTITFTGNRTIKVQNDTTVIFSARNIIIDSSIGAASNTCPVPEGQIQGIFSADRDIIVEGNDGDCTGGADEMLNVEGTLIANAARMGGSLQNKRDLCEDNPIYPSLTIKARPDFILHIPGFLNRQNSISYEDGL